MIYTLQRTAQSNQGTFGELLDPSGNQVAYTCEPPPDVNNPCIPDGTYQVIPHNSPAHPNTWEITNVPNRTAILIHNGNTDKDTLGCVIVGDSFGTVDGMPAVLNSNNTLAMLQKTLPPNFVLSINDIESN